MLEIAYSRPAHFSEVFGFNPLNVAGYYRDPFLYGKHAFCCIDRLPI